MNGLGSLIYLLSADVPLHSCCNFLQDTPHLDGGPPASPHVDQRSFVHFQYHADSPSGLAIVNKQAPCPPTLFLDLCTPLQTYNTRQSLIPSPDIYPNCDAAAGRALTHKPGSEMRDRARLDVDQSPPKLADIASGQEDAPRENMPVMQTAAAQSSMPSSKTSRPESLRWPSSLVNLTLVPCF